MHVPHAAHVHKCRWSFISSRCIRMNVSPVLGFLGIGVALGPAGLSVIKDLNELNILGGLGISFLLFEQGLELSLDRLRALSKYAFGLGSLQVLLCTLAFALFPFVGGVDFLEVGDISQGQT